MSGYFITFEGTEGAGKSTLIRELERAFQGRGLSVCVTREPGGSPVAEKIRSLILAEPMDAWTELLLYEASRAEHLQRTIRPAMESGQVVLCDRYADSSLAYQGAARGLPWVAVKRANQLATQGFTPDLTVFLDVDPERAWKRAQDRNRFEDEGVGFQRKVRGGYLKAMRENPRRWLRLKMAERTPEQLAETVLREFDRRFGKRVRRHG